VPIGYFPVDLIGNAGLDMLHRLFGVAMIVMFMLPSAAVAQTRCSQLLTPIPTELIREFVTNAGQLLRDHQRELAILENLSAELSR
jgi:hypothetical protein